ncbi:hypothetical protein EV715DRAFT_295639 [Schizophyllum commune]
MRRKLGERGIRWVTNFLHFYNEGGEGEGEDPKGEDSKGEDEDSKGKDEDSKGEDEDSKDQNQKAVTSRPVITIHVEPGGATAAQAHTASEEILALLEAQGKR